MSPDEFLVAMDASIVLRSGLDAGESTLKLGLMGVSASISVDA